MNEEELEHLLKYEMIAFELGYYEMSGTASNRLEELIQSAYALGLKEGYDIGCRDGQNNILFNRAY